MSTSDNVIQIKEFLKNNAEATNETISLSNAEVESITEIREEMISEERRKVKRTLLTEFVGASLIIPGSGLVKVSLNDISRGGLSFDVQEKYGQLKEGDKMAVRVYLNHTTYFPLSVTITNARFIKEEASYRHGAEFLKGTVNEEAVHHFIRFMETVSTSLKADLGDLMLSK
ncbi:MAG: PilZ domain-containing protein [Bdellovibrionales bacterium]